MAIDRTTIELAAVIPAGLGLWAALARWWRKCKPTIRIKPGLLEVKWQVDP